MRAITNKQELIERLAEEIDMSNDESWPYIDLTAQDVGLRFDSAWADKECDADLDGHFPVRGAITSSRNCSAPCPGTNPFAPSVPVSRNSASLTTGTSSKTRRC